jgi:3-hydroxyacyl-CoA dehydrogenase
MQNGKVRNVAVVGNEEMGIGIAQTFARGGVDVSLIGRSEANLRRAMQRMKDNLSLFVEMKLLSEEESDRIVARVHPTTDMESACRKAQYLTEAIPEIMEVKQELFRKADKWCPEDTILASCTSTLSVEEIASATGRPDRVVGTHWVKPAHIIELVEMIRSPKTSEKTLSATKSLLESVGKVVVTCRENPGHIHNAMQYALSRVAFDLLDRGIASAEDIDKAARHGLGFRMTSLGPIERLNLGPLPGFKLNWESINEKTGLLGPFPASVQKLIEQGQHGLKRYTDEETRRQTKERDRELVRSLRALGRI